MKTSSVIKDFFGYLESTFREITESQEESLFEASRVIAECIRDEDKGRVCHVWGPGGHSSIIAEETLYRKGGFASLNPVYDPGISLSHGALKEINGLERVKGYARVVLDYNNVKEGDVLVLGSAYGVNVVTLEAAYEAKERNVKVIAITSPGFSVTVKKDHPGRHESKKDLYEVADIVIDSKVPPGDAIIEIEGFSQKVGPIGTVIQSAVFQCLVALIAERLVGMGVHPKIWTNALDMGGVEANKAYIDQYYGKYKSL
jgi:uncharacterized phosphosugar-binding protein